jgi:ABC-type branched-subunit amino acid transport system ATPase component
VKKGEFICVIGDVGAGKTSLLKAIVGDMIYISQEELNFYGGPEAEIDEMRRDEWTKELLGNEYMAEQSDKPIKIAGSLSFVE